MKLAEYARMVSRMNWSEMRRMIEQVHRRSGKGRLDTLLDMVRCSRAYEAGFTDYYLMHFEDLTPAQRATYVTRGVNLRYIRALNDRAYYHVLDDKVEFNERFAAFVRREWLDLTRATADDLRQLCQRHPEVMAKPTDQSGGHGVELVSTDATTDFDALFARLVANGQTLVEERIRQCDEMARLCPTSVNTLRVVTILKDGEVHVMMRILRVGNGVNHVDNLHSGGMFCFFGEDGVVYCNAVDRDSREYVRHPTTGVTFRGFRIPFHEEAIDMVRRAALVVPQIGYAGWDVALAADGPQLIEGNQLPGYDLYQSNVNVGPDGMGVKPRFDAVVFGTAREGEGVTA